MKKLFMTVILFLLSMSVLTNAQTRRNTQVNRCTIKYYPVANGYTKRYANTSGGETNTLTLVQQYNAGANEFTEKISHSNTDTKLRRQFRCMPDGIRSLDLAQVMRSNADFKFQTSNDTGLTIPAGNLSVGQSWTTGYDLSGNFNIAAGQNRSDSTGSMNGKTTGTANSANQVLAVGEKVTVPGGTFNTVKIQTVMTIQINVLNAELLEKLNGLKLPMGNMKAPPTTMTVMQWYASGVGLIKLEVSSQYGNSKVVYLGSANAPDVDVERTGGDGSTGRDTDITPTDNDNNSGNNSNNDDNSGSGKVVKTNKTRLCTASPDVTLSGVNAQTAQSGIQKAFAELLDSSAIEVIALDARLPIMAKREAAEKQCDYVLNVALKQKKGKKSSGGMFGRILEGVTDRAITSTASNIPYGGNVGERIARDAAVRAAYEVAALNIQINKKDEFTLEYSLVGADSTTILQKTNKQKADKDGEDVITPMIEAAANEVATAVLSK